MLAVHDEKIEYQQKTDDLLLKMIDNVKEENERQHQKSSERIDDLEDRVSEISKIKWMTVGCGILLAVLTTAISTLASGWWTPSEMHQIRDDLRQQPSSSNLR
jgi:hypothetical protein